MRATHLGTDDAMEKITRKQASRNLQIGRGGDKSGRCGCPALACNGGRAQTLFALSLSDLESKVGICHDFSASFSVAPKKP